VLNEYFIPGTDPVYPCTVHTQFNLYPDTLGTTGTYPYPPGYVPRPIDSSYRSGGTSLPTPRPRDSMPRNLDSAIWTMPGRPDTGRRTVFPRDTIRRIRPDSVARPDTFLRRPRIDTVRVKPDTIRPRPDTLSHRK
jgi:hypothetical protein